MLIKLKILSFSLLILLIFVNTSNAQNIIPISNIVMEICGDSIDNVTQEIYNDTIDNDRDRFISISLC